MLASKRNRVILTSVAVAAVIATWIYMEKKHVDSVYPPATSLVVFLDKAPQPIRIRKFTYSGRTYIEVMGGVTSQSGTLASGPPLYIFDDTGTLVDWIADSGDSPSFIRKWNGFSNATVIGQEEATLLVEQASGTATIDEGG